MSDDLIRRSDVYKAVDDWLAGRVPNLNIKDIPSADRPQGEWAKRTEHTLIAQVNFAYCSECGQPIMHEHTRPLWNFCPNCGAKMKGADDE